MKKKINVLRLKKTVITNLNNEIKQQRPQPLAGTSPAQSCHPICLHTRFCP